MGRRRGETLVLVGAACADRRAAADTGLMYALLNYADAEAKLAELPVVGDVTAELGLCYLVLAAGLVQGFMGTKTNWARKAYVSAAVPPPRKPQRSSCRRRTCRGRTPWRRRRTRISYCLTRSSVLT